MGVYKISIRIQTREIIVLMWRLKKKLHTEGELEGWENNHRKRGQKSHEEASISVNLFLLLFFKRTGHIEIIDSQRVLSPPESEFHTFKETEKSLVRLEIEGKQQN